MKSAFAVGDAVHSMAFRSRDTFDGVVSEVLGAHAFHVRDDEGLEWHRETSELKRIPK